MKFSIVMPIHNDEEFLSSTLPSVWRVEPNEIILVFDEGDKDIEATKALIKKSPYGNVTRLIEVGNSPDWKFRIAFVRRAGFLAAKNEVILNTDADTILDPKIKEYLDLIGRDGIALISFRRLEFPLSFSFFVRGLLILLHLEEPFSPIYAFQRQAWFGTEDFESLRKLETNEDAHLHHAISKKHKILFKEVSCVHLKPVLTKARKYSEGKARWQENRNPMWKALARTIVYLDFDGMMGYLHARWNGKDPN
ncbi:MAG: glycosyltransferase [Candidatus Bathyarchaeia archaeon]|jgi:glycosyltransferase involved in cell wall biosynthesis